METMSEKERKLLRELQAKSKRVERQQKEFLEYADSNKDILLERWGIDEQQEDKNHKEMSDRILVIAQMYGTDVETLLKYIATERQINYFRNYVK